MAELTMSKEQIVREYNEAKDKADEIHVLDDLNVTHCPPIYEIIVADAICAQTRRVRDRVLAMTEAILDAMGRDGAAPEDNEGVRYRPTGRYDEEV